MKKSMIALAAMMLLTSAAKAQTITAETVLNIYLEAVQSNSKEFAYNADISDGIVTAQYIYAKQQQGMIGQVMLKPQLKHCYNYDTDGRLTCRTTYLWNEYNNDWQTCYQLTYSYTDTQNIVECSRWSTLANRFLAPTERMVYEADPFGTEGIVSNYHRKNGKQDYVLTSTLSVAGDMLLGNKLLTTHP